MGDESFERVRLQAAPLSDLNDFRHGWKAVPFQDSCATGSFRSLLRISLAERSLSEAESEEREGYCGLSEIPGNSTVMRVP